jgi:RNA polymerase sigma factor (TIGR02999 family)
VRAEHEVTRNTDWLDESASADDLPFMPHPSAGADDVTALLVAVRAGDDAARDRLFTVLYDELRRIAARRVMAAGDTLSATALVHEVFLKLAAGAVQAGSRAHFLATAARAMRQLVIDRQRERDAAKRGGDWARTTLGDGPAAVELPADDALALADALDRLDPRQRQVVEYRLFAGMEESEIAQLLDVSERTVRRDWVKGRAWLMQALMLKDPT